MTKDQIAFWNSLTNTHLVLLDFSEPKDGSKSLLVLPALKDGINELGDLLAGIDVQSKKQADSSGVSLAKENALLALGDATYDVARAVRAYASENGNPILAGQVMFSRSELVRGADKKIIDRAELIRDAAADTIDELADYGVTQVKVTTLTKKIEAFRKAQPMPRQRTGKSSAATKELKQIFQSARELLNERVDGLLVQYKASHAEFYNQYVSARKIVEPASRAKKSDEQAGGESASPQKAA